MSDTNTVNNKSSLDLIRDYGESDSDSSSHSSEVSFSDNEDDSSVSCEMIPTDDIGFENAQFRDLRMVKSDDDSDSHNSSNSSSSDDDSSDEPIEISNNERKTKDFTPRTKGELRLCDLPPIEDLTISVPEEDCIKMGTVSSIVEELVIIEALPNIPVYDIDTILFLKNGKETLGKIFDVFGRTNSPCYSVRFNTPEDIANKGITPGTEVFSAPTKDYTAYVDVPRLESQKGSDASWREDNEPPPTCLDFSDDEQERSLRNSKKDSKTAKQPEPTDFEKHMNKRNKTISARYAKRQPIAVNRPQMNHLSGHRTYLPPNSSCRPTGTCSNFRQRPPNSSNSLPRSWPPPSFSNQNFTYRLNVPPFTGNQPTLRPAAFPPPNVFPNHMFPSVPMFGPNLPGPFIRRPPFPPPRGFQ